MPLSVQCGKCGKRLQVPDALAGKRGKCPACQAVVQVPVNSGVGKDQADRKQRQPTGGGAKPQGTAAATKSGSPDGVQPAGGTGSVQGRTGTAPGLLDVASQGVGPAPSRKELQRQILTGLEGRIEDVELTSDYRFGTTLVACVMIALVCTCAAMPCLCAEPDTPTQGSAAGTTDIRPESGDAEEAASDLYQVWVEGESVPVYRCRVSAVPLNWTWPGYQRPKEQTEEAAFAGWDMSGTVRVKVVSSRSVNRVTVRPLASGIKPVLEKDGHTFSFRLERPGQLVIEVNDAHHALHLFADPVEENPCREGDAGVLYFGPGVHEAGPITLEDDQTVYLARGAIVHGTIAAKNAAHVRVCGRGILDISRASRGDEVGGVLFEDCRDVQVEGITIRDPRAGASNLTAATAPPWPGSS